jgi:hypothetical protein
MTPADHNRALAILHGLAALLTLAGLVAMATLGAEGHVSELTHRAAGELYLLPLPLLQLLTASGLFTKKRWGRFLALAFSLLYLLLFPLGTLLAIYTWYFLHSRGGRELYRRGELGESDAG